MLMKISIRCAGLSAAALLSLTPAAHAARTFCCSDERGQQRCGDVLPVECRNQAYVEYNEAGVRVRGIDAPLTEAQQAAKEAEERKQREVAEAAEQQKRSDRALLSTYADEKDLDTALNRSVAELERSIKSGEARLVELNKTKVKLEADAEFFENKPLPPDLKQNIVRNQSALANQQMLIDQKKKEVEETRAKFEGFRKRLQELKSKDMSGSL